MDKNHFFGVDDLGSTAGRPPARAARMLWRRIVGLLHVDAGKEEFARLLEHARKLPAKVSDREDLIHCIELALTVKERIELHQERERGLLAVLETAQDLTAITDPDHILEAIVQRARKLLGSDVGYLSIHDTERNDFYVRATDGAFSENFIHIRVPRDVGICNFVARHRMPYASSDYGVDGRFPHDIGIDSAVVEEHIVSILGVPLLAGASVIGVLFVGDRYVRSYTPWEKHILSILAAHASVALNNARLFEQTQTALRQASDTNLELARRTADADRAAQAHERLTALAARGGNLSDICDMAASMLGGRVTAYDGGEREIACAGEPPQNPTTDTEAIDPDEGALHRALHESRIAGRSIEVRPDGRIRYRVAAATSGSSLLGGLTIRTAAPLRDADIRTFERTAVLASVVLLSREQRESAGRQALSALVHELIGLPQDLMIKSGRLAMRHGLDPALPIQLILLAGTDAGAGLPTEWTPRTTAGLAHAIFGVVRGSLVILANSRHVPGIVRQLPGFLGNTWHQALTGVISDPVPAFSQVNAAYHRVLQCLRIVQALNYPQRLFQEAELALYALLLDRELDLDTYLRATLGTLYSPRDRRKCRLARTALTWLDSARRPAATARTLGIHPNTVHQRLATVDALLPDWRHHPRVLDVHIALRLWGLAGHWETQDACDSSQASTVAAASSGGNTG
ncbi:GAF domain-containing protein [Castellaniella sp. MT123]|uniref:GAF domain-containing protein n=1 Tax=Castellaniella sp. MT123 TaxID=3140381 RepID=UPI0031F45450